MIPAVRSVRPPGPDVPPEELRFHFLSGRRCLDLVATVGERWRRSFERLRTPSDLARWLHEAGLVDRPPRVTPRQLQAARELREAIFRAALAAMAGRAPGPRDAAVLNAWAARPPRSPRLEGGRVRWGARRAVEAALAEVARDAVDLVGGPLARRIRACAGEECSLLFVDTSRPGRRRWCSMARCGNRTKVRAYRARTAEGGRIHAPG
jgi:predicted RNA-binding Zn ribbon-like protein